MTGELILIVEDHALNAKLIRDFLQVKGYRVIESTTAEKGLQLAREHGPDLILMDIRLPGMDGVTALQELKRDEATRHIPVMAVTASVMPSERDESRAADHALTPMCPAGRGSLVFAARRRLREQ